MSFSLKGKLLIATPSLGQSVFHRAIIHLCMHNHEGALGLVINRPTTELTFTSLLHNLSIPVRNPHHEHTIYMGGPVETSRGFVLHSPDYHADDATLPVCRASALTSTRNILQTIAHGKGPQHALLALGYAGWAASQLEAELQDNAWLCCDSDPHILFQSDAETRYNLALARLGIEPAHLSTHSGNA